MSVPAELTRLVDDAAGIVQRRQLGRRLLWCVAALPLAVLAAVMIDALLAPGTWLRLLMTALMIVGPLAAGVAALLHAPRLLAVGEAARRLAERALGDEQRSLSAALELAGMPGQLAHAGAGRLAAGIDGSGLDANLPSAGVHRPLLTLIAAIGGFAVLALALPNLLPAVLPRLLDPFGDHPPYSATRLVWGDVPASARPGDQPRLIVRTVGPAPKELWLNGDLPGLAEPVRVPLVQESADRWAVTLAPLPAPPVATGAVAVLWADGAGTRTTRLRLPLDPIPVLRDCVVTLTAPPYAKLDDQVASAKAGSPATLAALPRSTVALKPSANRPLSALWLTFENAPAQRHLLIEGVFRLNDPAPGRYVMRLEAEDGIRGDALPLMAISRRTDQPPEVRIVAPATDGIATPTATIPLAIEASDDLGVASLTWQVLVDGKLREEHVETLGGASDTFRGPLKLSGLKEGQEVRIVAVARDTLPPDGQLSPSATRTLTIISDKAYNDLVRDQIAHDALLQKYGPLLERLAELETQAAAKTPPAEPQTESRRQHQMEELAQKIQELAKETTALERPEPLFELETDLQREIAERLAELEQDAKNGKSGATGKKGNERGEQLKHDLERLTAKAEADALGDRLEELATAQEQVAQELADLKRRAGAKPSDADKARMRELAKRQQEVNEALGDWKQFAEETAKRLEKTDPQDAAAIRGVCKALDEQKLDALTDGSARLSRAGNASGAEPLAREAGERLRALAGTRMSGDCQNGWCRSDRMGKGRGQLSRLAKLGMSRGGSQSGTGGGATGAAGGGLMVRPGGKPRGANMPLYGPEPLASLAGGRPGGNGQAPGATAVRDADGSLHPATPYATGTRATDAGIGAPLGPGERRMVDDYFRRLDGDPLAPAPTPSKERP